MPAPGTQILAAVERISTTLVLRGKDLPFWATIGHRWKVEEDRFDLLVGSASADIRLGGQLQVISAR